MKHLATWRSSESRNALKKKKNESLQVNTEDGDLSPCWMQSQGCAGKKNDAEAQALQNRGGSALVRGQAPERRGAWQTPSLQVGAQSP